MMQTTIFLRFLSMLRFPKTGSEILSTVIHSGTSTFMKLFITCHKNDAFESPSCNLLITTASAFNRIRTQPSQWCSQNSFGRNFCHHENTYWHNYVVPGSNCYGTETKNTLFYAPMQSHDIYYTPSTVNFRTGALGKCCHWNKKPLDVNICVCNPVFYFFKKIPSYKRTCCYNSKYLSTNHVQLRLLEPMVTASWNTLLTWASSRIHSTTYMSYVDNVWNTEGGFTFSSELCTMYLYVDVLSSPSFSQFPLPSRHSISAIRVISFCGNIVHHHNEVMFIHNHDPFPINHKREWKQQCHARIIYAVRLDVTSKSSIVSSPQYWVDHAGLVVTSFLGLECGRLPFLAQIQEQTEIESEGEEQSLAFDLGAHYFAEMSKTTTTVHAILKT